jgi:hypothetical protein
MEAGTVAPEDLYKSDRKRFMVPSRCSGTRSALRTEESGNGLLRRG